MKLPVCFLIVILAVIVRADRNVRRDVGQHHIKGEQLASQSKVELSGYGKDTPPSPLPVSLVSTASSSAGYPRENPPNPLKLDAQAANKVEVVVDNNGATTVNPMMMMGGEIPGNAGTDYPIFDTVPETKFNCKDQETGGYYADIEEGRCQVFHVCHDQRKFSFLCPNGTIFDQKVFVCNWWFNVDCAASAQFYNLNAQIGVVPEKPSTSSSSSEPLAVAPSIVNTKIASPNLNYLPPQQTTKDPIIEAPSLAYIPPAVAPNVAEAITNGIITPTTTTTTTIAPTLPAQSYLPPN